jgi:hypothetical protein
MFIFSPVALVSNVSDLFSFFHCNQFHWYQTTSVFGKPSLNIVQTRGMSLNIPLFSS